MAAAAPGVTGVTLTSGPTTGGTNVTVTGSGFLGASAVTFGSVAAAGFTVVSDTTIFAVAPAEAAGTVDVTVTTPTGTSATGAGDQFTYQAPGTLTATGVGTINMTAGTPWSGIVGSLADTDTMDTTQYTAVINWGNGVAGFGTILPAGFAIQSSGSITYSQAGTYTITVEIYDIDGSSTSFTDTASVSSGGGGAPMAPTTTTSSSTPKATGTTVSGAGGSGGGAPLASTTTTSSSRGPKATGTTATATHNVAFAGPVASFMGDIAGGTAANYTAKIDWGNGTTTTGTVARTGDNTFGVSCGVTYLKPGKYTVKITITDSGGGSATVTTTILVADARPADPDAEEAPENPDVPEVATALVWATGPKLPDDAHQSEEGTGALSVGVTGLQTTGANRDPEARFADARLGLSEDWLEEGDPAGEDMLLPDAAADQPAAESLPSPAQPAPEPEAVEPVGDQPEEASTPTPAPYLEDDGLLGGDQSTDRPALPAANDALFIALSDAQEEADAAERMPVAVPAGDDTGASGWSDLIALPVALLDELFALL
jgi:hypothetical protein